MFDISFAGALLAGMLSFLTPCVLPMVPFYLSYLGGLGISELREDGAIAPGAQRRLLLAAILFALGVTTIFVLLGMGATALGQAFGEYLTPLSWIGAAILTLFGLHFLGVVRIPFLMREARLKTGSGSGSLPSAYLMGLAFGFGWTPCVGPALAAILFIASGFGDIWRGGLLLLVYGLGMSGPFVLVALFAKPFLAWVQRHRGAFVWVEKAMGAMLIVFAILIVTGTVNQIGAAMLRWFPGWVAIS
jgi:cytochrome c-type biogenesis protein